MGYTFTIGKAVLESGETPIDHDPLVVPTVRPASKDLDDVHADEFEERAFKGSARRSISYGTWENVIGRVPAMDELWDDMKDVYRDRQYVPVSYYIGRLDEIEAEATALLRGEERLDRDEWEGKLFLLNERDPLESLSGRVAAGVRLLWFVRWSRAAYEEYGELAVFDKPGEWG